MTRRSVANPNEAAAKAERGLQVAEKILTSAEKTYRKKPSRENLIALKAANKLVKESQALVQEWT